MSVIPSPVIDIHVHITPWGLLHGPALDNVQEGRTDLPLVKEVSSNPKALIDLMDRLGIQRLGMINYVSPEIMGFTNEVNEFAAKFAAEFRDRLIPFGGLHPKFSDDIRRELDHIFKGLGLKALKIHPPHQGFPPNAYLDPEWEGLAQIYSYAQRYGIPVMIHTGSSNFPRARSRLGQCMLVDDVAVDFPELILILAHGGRPLWMEEAFFMVRRHKNVYMDISSIPPRRLLQYFPRLEEISHKVLYGSDWPGPGVHDMGDNLKTFWALNLTKDAKRRILFGNAAKIFG